MNRNLIGSLICLSLLIGAIALAQSSPERRQVDRTKKRGTSEESLDERVPHPLLDEVRRRGDLSLINDMPPERARQLQGKTAIGPPGRYSIASTGEGAILLDTLTGKTWILRPSSAHGAEEAWFLLERIDRRHSTGDVSEEDPASEDREDDPFQ